MWSLESNNCNATINNSKPKKTCRWMLWISRVRNEMFLQLCFVTWLVGILTDFYYKELIEIGAKTPFLFGTRPNMWGILASLFSKVYFCIADLTLGPSLDYGTNHPHLKQYMHVTCVWQGWSEPHTRGFLR